MENFNTWLATQLNRTDAIGILANAAKTDKEFPKGKNLATFLTYLTDKGANEASLNTLRQAFTEYQKNQGITETNTEPDEEPVTPKRRGRKPGSKNKITVDLEDTKGENNKPQFVAAEAEAPQETENKPATVTSSPKRRGRPKKEVNPKAAAAKNTPNTAKQTETKTQAPAKRGPKPKAAPIKVPARLANIQQQLRDAAIIIDAQFGRGYAEANPGKVIECMRLMVAKEQHLEQTTLVKSLVRELAEVVVRFTKK